MSRTLYLRPYYRKGSTSAMPDAFGLYRSRDSGHGGPVQWLEADCTGLEARKVALEFHDADMEWGMPFHGR